MNKILKILSILVIGFVMFSCSTPTNDPTIYVPDPKYSIIFTTKDSYIQIVVDYLNSLDEFKNLEEGTEVMLYKHVYLNSDTSEVTKEIVETSAIDFTVKYDDNSEIDSIVIGNEDVEIDVICEDLLQFKD